jgi:hypothetical protein
MVGDDDRGGDCLGGHSNGDLLVVYLIKHALPFVMVAHQW